MANSSFSVERGETMRRTICVKIAKAIFLRPRYEKTDRRIGSINYLAHTVIARKPIAGDPPTLAHICAFDFIAFYHDRRSFHFRDVGIEFNL